MDDISCDHFLFFQYTRVRSQRMRCDEHDERVWDRPQNCRSTRYALSDIRRRYVLAMRNLPTWLTGITALSITHLQVTTYATGSCHGKDERQPAPVLTGDDRGRWRNHIRSIDPSELSDPSEHTEHLSKASTWAELLPHARCSKCGERPGENTGRFAVGNTTATHHYSRAVWWHLR